MKLVISGGGGYDWCGGGYDWCGGSLFDGQRSKIGYFDCTLVIHANHHHGSKCHLIIGQRDDQDICELLILITL